MDATVIAAAIGVGGSVIVALAAFWANVRNTNKTTALCRCKVTDFRRPTDIRRWTVPQDHEDPSPADTPALTAAYFDQTFTAAAASPSLRRVWELAEPGLPPQIEPFSFVTVGLLRHVAQGLDLSPGQTLADLGCGRLDQDLCPYRKGLLPYLREQQLGTVVTVRKRGGRDGHTSSSGQRTTTSGRGAGACDRLFAI